MNIKLWDGNVWSDEMSVRDLAEAQDEAQQWAWNGDYQTEIVCVRICDVDGETIDTVNVEIAQDQ